MIADVQRYLPPNVRIVGRRVILARPPVTVSAIEAAAILGWNIWRLQTAIRSGRVDGAYLDSRTNKWRIPLPITVRAPRMGPPTGHRGKRGGP